MEHMCIYEHVYQIDYPLTFLMNEYLAGRLFSTITQLYNHLIY